MEVAERMREFTSFIVMDVMEAAERLEHAGKRVVHLEVGEPDFDPPRPVMEEMERALREGRTHYTHSLGIRALREAIAQRYARRYGVEVSPDRVCVTTGSSAAFLLVFAALLNPGDGVAMTDPGYPCYPNFARFVAARPVLVPVSAREGFRLTPAALQAVDPRGLKAFMISSPSNPAGTVTLRETYQAILARGHILISDEIYHGLVYGGVREFTALELSDQAIVVDGFSKRYAMTGCRLGWLVVPPELARPVNRLAQNLYISPPTLSQYGALAALQHGDSYVGAMRDEYAMRHRLLVDGLRSLGFGISHEPEGAFYVFADI